MQGYVMYVVTVGVVVELVLVLKRVCEAWDAWSSGQSLGEEETTTCHSLGSEGLRVVLGLLGVVGCLWYILQLVWRMDVDRSGGLECGEGGMEAGVLGLAVAYCLLHIFVLFYNVKLVVKGFETVVVWGLMHLLAADVSLWAWSAARLSLLNLSFDNRTAIRKHPNTASHSYVPGTRML